MSISDLEELVPDDAEVLGYQRIKEMTALQLNGETIALLQKLIDTAKEQVKDNPPGHGVTVSALCPNVYEAGRHYLLQFNISLAPMDEKSRAN